MTIYFREYGDIDEQPDFAATVRVSDGRIGELADSEVDLTPQGFEVMTLPYEGIDITDLPLPHYVRLYRYMEDGHEHPRNCPPFEVDFMKGLGHFSPLKQITKIEKGDITERHFYGRYVGRDSAANPIHALPLIRESIHYEHDADGAAHLSQEKTIEYYLEDGTLHPDSKTKMKYYSLAEGILAGVRRRKNIIDYLKPDVVGLLLLAGAATTTDQAFQLGTDMVSARTIEILNFENASSQALFTSLQNGTESWLDLPLPGNPSIDFRMFMLSRIDIWGLLG